MTIKTLVGNADSGINSVNGDITDGIGNVKDTISTAKNDASSIIGSIASIKSTYSTINNSVTSAFNALANSSTGDDGGSDTQYLPVEESPTYDSDTINYIDTDNATIDDSILVYPKNLTNITVNPAHINFQFFKRDSTTTLTSIHLPMPDEVKNPSTINWDTSGVSLGMVGNAIINSLKASQSGDGSQDAVQTALSSMGERVKALAWYNGVSQSIQKASLGSNNVSAETAMGLINGKIPNPYRAVLFRGVDFRSFNFTFTLVPFTEDDCDLIDTIINQFRSHSYPEFSGEKMFFDYPDECEITYIWKSEANKWLNSFKRAVCTSVEVDYTPANGQWNSLRNGFPNAIKLITRWSEIEIITKDDITTQNGKGQKS